MPASVAGSWVDGVKKEGELQRGNHPRTPLSLKARYQSLVCFDPVAFLQIILGPLGQKTHQGKRPVFPAKNW